jgi:hypothetical protein
MANRRASALRTITLNIGGGDVQTFTMGFPRGTLLGRLGRNRLVRATDRVEALATILLFLLGVATIPVVVTVGMSTHQHQAAMYARQAGSVHQAAARVTASRSVAPNHGSKDVSDAQITWDVDGLPRGAPIRWREYLTAGDQIPIWVDGTGKLSGKPMSPDQAVMDGVVVAVFLWTAVVAVGVGGQRLLVWRLDRHRDAQWDRELETLSTDGGGRADHQS